MENAARILALSRRDLPFYEYAREFCGLAAGTALDDTPVNHLFWFGANYHCPVDLPDTTGLSWREGIFCCLGSVRPEPEPARRPVHQPNPSQACQPPLTQACRRPRLSQACRSWGKASIRIYRTGRLHEDEGARVFPVNNILL